MTKLLKYFKAYLKETILAPLFKLFEAILELFIPLIVAAIINTGIKNSDKTYIVLMVCLMVGLGLLGLGFSILGQYFSAKSSVGYCTKVRHDLFEKLQNLTFSQIDRLGTSSMITRITYDVNQVQTGINLTLRLLLRSPFVVFGATIIATVLLPSRAYIFWLMLLVLSIIVFGIMLISIPLHKKVQNNLDIVLNNTRENLTGVRVIRAFGVEEKEINTYTSSTKNLQKSQNKVGRISNLMNPLTYIIVNIAIILLVYVGAFDVFDGVILQGTLIAIYNYMTQILVELIKLANLIITITKSLASSKRILNILNMDSTEILTQEEKKENISYITFDHVALKYSQASMESLTDIDFTVDKGDVIGIIGGTGSGKTSLVGLLNRSYDVSEGTLYIDGYNINNYTPSLIREKIGYVLQKAVIFKGTIRDNIKWGNPDATDEEIIDALEKAQALNVVMKKPGGLDEMVEQNGRNFSGGERQRLSIARALVKKPEILILDDSSSALDLLTEKALRKSIFNLDYKPTIFIVSQRTSSIMHATKIIVLDDGKIVGIGTHDELLNNCEVYQEIYYSQYKKEDNDYE
ncbi:MAG: ABC transporter ATP-binding protein/permease [Bacilli bacterium]|nr:ABC transporter ATP-binding protein/permease [Bacilli bacterium]